MEDIFFDIRPDEDSSGIYEDDFHLDYLPRMCDEQIFSICPTTDFSLDFFSSKCLGNCFDCHDSQDPFMLTDTNPMWSQIFVIQSPQNKSRLEKPLHQQSLLKAINKNGLSKFHLVAQPKVQKPLPMCQALVNPQDICPIIFESKRRNCLLQNISSNSGKTSVCVGKENKKIFKSCSSNSDYGSETSDDYQIDLKFFEDDCSKVNDEYQIIKQWHSESSGSDEEKLIDIENLEYNSQNVPTKSQKCKLKPTMKIKSEPVKSLETQFGQFNSYNIKVEPSYELENLEDIKNSIKTETVSHEYLINEMHNYSTGPLKVIKYMSHSAPQSPLERLTKSTKKKKVPTATLR